MSRAIFSKDAAYLMIRLRTETLGRATFQDGTPSKWRAAR
jgi:hypothetical protein